ncbi:hypothetical protein AURANDRAFT_69750 [Aureococcus anophagefferens]|uniref:DUF4440 domain-containing protein n=1 Tax=Aureococcus anophagefferens TaxID=44056 RepID=F0Y588_AURAN|nr:hypothetical protein AURANDRAFT_69750 [Aureococcus anophagefferens]EGB09454.1 hypothetical protein AURANDRAFT_69750 [Aureococcus anophagefferens]|mmetsp:Transcript_36321/g.122990  ORF Transcript_36321/g.122990 Transcript_36321/m.122990 type:complete len:127 (-) Transcript_36321:70-450(-)|eukprot:XP_009035521.1 hypothetical protein AURANDRAFT_69750 [Aureococcus anophagefferens]
MAAELETMISEFCSIKMGDWIAGNTTDDFQFVRPTGNPIDKIGFPAMMTGDVVVQAGELKKIHKLEVSGDMAFACLTQYGKFTYKGTPNEDICVMTLIFKKVDGAWKLAWAQRSSGRKPDEPAPSF